MSVRAALQSVSDLAALLDGRRFADLSDAELVAGLDLLGSAQRLLNAAGVEAAGEVDERCVVEDGRSLSRAFGAKTAPHVVAERVGLSLGEARTWCSLADAVRPQISLTGEILPARFESVGRALQAGVMAVATAELIVRTVNDVRPFLGGDDVYRLEALLVEKAPQFSRRDFTRLCRAVPEDLFPAGVEMREDLQRARSGLRFIELADGRTRMIVDMHPEAAGFVATSLDVRTAPRRQPIFELDPQAGDVLARDDRTLAQRRLDALVDMARESLARDDGEVAGTSVTMVVTIGIEALRSGLGTAEIAGVDERISAATARRLAADAEIIPCVLGGSSEILDQGRAFRLFTAPQRRALAVRDGGCVWPGCNAPPGWCEVAHLRSWLDGGGTDLANGVLLCPFHHRRLDHDGWEFRWRGGELWLIPPAHLDASRTPRRAGRVPAVVL
jgi:5-methylcytosine-specific restriction protein A